jgi:hypothetical protein
MYRILTSLLICLCFSSFCRAQGNYYNQSSAFLKSNSNWAIGKYAGINFNTNPPSGLKTGVFTSEGSSVVSDTVSGALLFYTNGASVWDKDHNLMPNGTGLLGDTVRNWNGQATAVIALPGSATEYAIFHLSQSYKDHTTSTKLARKLYYTIVDMALNGGLGDVVATRKNILLDGASFGAMIAAVPGDNCDIWVLTHLFAQPVYKAFRITSAGIDPTPVVSTITGGSVLPGANAYSEGYLTFAPDRTRLAMCTKYLLSADTMQQGAFLADFNVETGSVTDEFKIYNGESICIAFSPDGSKVYTNLLASTLSTNSNLMQFDLTSYTRNDILTSRTLVPGGRGTHLMRTYGEEIYVSQYYRGGSFLPRNTWYVSYMKKPNLSADSTEFISNERNNWITWDPGSSIWENSYLGLGNDVITTIHPDTSFAPRKETIFCKTTEQQQFIINAPENYRTYTWSDGSADTSLDISAEGIYWLVSQDLCNYRVDTYAVTIYELMPIINVELNELGTTKQYVTYQWLWNGKSIEGATGSRHIITKNGNYQVIVGNGQDCTDTSNVYVVNNVNIIHAKGSATSHKVYPNPTSDNLTIEGNVEGEILIYGLDGRLVKKHLPAKQIFMGDLAEGFYFLVLTDSKGRIISRNKIIKQH